MKPLMNHLSWLYADPDRSRIALWLTEKMPSNGPWMISRKEIAAQLRINKTKIHRVLQGMCEIGILSIRTVERQHTELRFSPPWSLQKSETGSEPGSEPVNPLVSQGSMGIGETASETASEPNFFQDSKSEPESETSEPLELKGSSTNPETESEPKGAEKICHINNNNIYTNTSNNNDNINNNNKASKKVSKSKKERYRREYPPDFETFWNLNPRKGHGKHDRKDETYKHWCALIEIATVEGRKLQELDELQRFAERYGEVYKDWTEASRSKPFTWKKFLTGNQWREWLQADDQQPHQPIRPGEAGSNDQRTLDETSTDLFDALHHARRTARDSQDLGSSMPGTNH